MMRQVLIGDIIAAARSVLDVPRGERMPRLERMLEQAHWADKLTKRTGRPHSIWGNGSLMAASRTEYQCYEPFLADQTYLEALRDTLDQVILWKQREPSQKRHKD